MTTAPKTVRRRSALVVAIVSFLTGLGLAFAGEKVGVNLKPLQPTVEEAVNDGVDATVDAVTKKK